MTDRVLILSEENGQILDEGERTIIGNRTVALITDQLRKNGLEVVFVDLNLCSIREGQVYCQQNNEEVNLNELEFASMINLAVSQEFVELERVVQSILEKKQRFAETSCDVQFATMHKVILQDYVNKSVFSPESFSLVLMSDLFKVEECFNRFLLKNPEVVSENLPVCVFKKDIGNHGRNIEMIFASEYKKLQNLVKSELLNARSCLIQEYIKPELLIAEASSANKFSSHFRLVISDYGNGYELIGGIYLQRADSWVSNSSCNEGVLYKLDVFEALKNYDKNIVNDLIADLCKIGAEIGIAQFGADIIFNNAGQPFIIELNDNIPLHGEIMEKQNLVDKFIVSHLHRLNKHKEMLEETRQEELVS